MKTQLNEVKRLQKIAGILKESDEKMLAGLVDQIVGKANGSKEQEYAFTKDVLNQNNVSDGSTILDLRDYARGANYHEIADACEDILSGKISLDN